MELGRMSMKLIGGALVTVSLLLLPVLARAGNSHGGGSSAPTDCLSLLYPTTSAPAVCKGYTYTCVSVFCPHQLAVFTDSDAI
jgi:hypothetical protein